VRGEFIGVWPDMWRHVWRKLADHRYAPGDLFCELYRELNPALVEPLDSATDLAAIVDDVDQARTAFSHTRASDLRGELALVDFLQRAHGAIVGFDDIAFENRYFVLIKAFIEKYNLRYDLRRPFSLHPTLPGIFARLIRELQRTTQVDARLAQLMSDFEEAIRDLRDEQSPRRIKLCIQAQIMLLEAIAQRFPGVRATTLGRMSSEINSWPHPTIRLAMNNLYGFASDYPGIRHAGNPAGVLREIDMRDLVAVSILLAGFTPYLSDMLRADDMYFEHDG
jgi:hypothetical protein